jgi:hypothetical protein
MYAIQITTLGFPEAIRKLEKVLDIVENQRDDIATAALHGAATVFVRNFQTEGRTSGHPWPKLAASTQSEREILGFDPEHPILIRYGGLEYATSTYLVTAPKTARLYSVDTQGKAIGIDISASSDTVTVVAYGEKAANQVGGGPTDVPERMYWFTTNQVMLKAHDAAVDWLADAIKRV